MTQGVFDCGDLVQLRSGGPPMTVEIDASDFDVGALDHIGATKGVHCVWMVDGEARHAVFPRATLKLLDSRSGRT